MSKEYTKGDVQKQFDLGQDYMSKCNDVCSTINKISDYFKEHPEFK